MPPKKHITFKVGYFLLFPLVFIYASVLRIRHFFYDHGILKSSRFKTPIISIGNLALGGTGKTPMTEYIINLLSLDYSLAVVSRGYKRKRKGQIIVNDSHNTDDIGDEPFQIFRKFKQLKMVINSDRTQAIKSILDYDVIILDDALQHRKLNPQFRILLTAYENMFTEDCLLPFGTLRDLKYRAKYSDVIIITKCPHHLDIKTKNSIKYNISKYAKGIPILYAKINYLNIKGPLAKADYSNIKITAFSGLADDTPFLDFLHKENIHFEYIKYSDHHEYSKKDIDVLNSKPHLLTSEKDYVKLFNKLTHVSYVPIETQFLTKKDQDVFHTMIYKLINNR